jgi:hypothetical protein
MACINPKAFESPPQPPTAACEPLLNPLNNLLRPTISLSSSTPPDSVEMRTVNLIVDCRGWRESQLARIESIVSMYQTSSSGPLIIEAEEIRRAVETVILSFYVLD